MRDECAEQCGKANVNVKELVMLSLQSLSRDSVPCRLACQELQSEAPLWQVIRRTAYSLQGRSSFISPCPVFYRARGACFTPPSYPSPQPGLSIFLKSEEPDPGGAVSVSRAHEYERVLYSPYERSLHLLVVRGYAQLEPSRTLTPAQPFVRHAGKPAIEVYAGAGIGTKTSKSAWFISACVPSRT